jgi:hypothetical protein
MRVNAPIRRCREPRSRKLYSKSLSSVLEVEYLARWDILSRGYLGKRGLFAGERSIALILSRSII